MPGGVEHIDDPGLARPDFPGPRCRDAADVQSAHENQGCGAPLGAKVYDQSFVAAKQAIDAGYGCFVHAEQVARNVTRGDEIAGQRRVHTMVVIGCQINRREVAVDELFRFSEVRCEEVAQRIIDSLCLEDRISPDRAGKTDRAIDRGHNGVRIVVHLAGAVPEFTNEKLIECCEFAWDSEFYLVEVDVKGLREIHDQKIFDARVANTCNAPDERSEPMARQHVLQHDKQVVQHQSFSSGNE